MLHKRKTSEPAVAEHIPSHLLAKKTSQGITCTYAFTKVLGVEWDPDSDTFCPIISSPSSEGRLTKRTLLSHITHECVVCRREASKLSSQLLCHLPPDRLNPGPVFHQVVVDYASPIMVKSWSPRKPFVTQAYVCVLVLFTLKAVHLEPVSELTTAAFIATLRRFMARLGKPIVIWTSDVNTFQFSLE